MPRRPINYIPPRLPITKGWSWQDRHLAAIHAPRGPEVPILHLLKAWLGYADQHEARFESGIGEDTILGPEWARIGTGIRGLLNGETGRLDCGTLDTIISDTLEAEGFHPEEL